MMLHPEEVIWQGRPRYKFRWAFLEIFGGGRSVLMIMLIPIVLVSLVFGLIWAHQNDELLVAFFLYLFLALLLFGPALHKYLRRSKTHYQLTENYIVIRDFWYGKEYHHIIHLEDVIKFYLENFNDNIGVIHIFVKNKPPLVTRDFWSGNPRFHITLEDIYPADKVYLKLREYLQDWRRRQKK